MKVLWLVVGVSVWLVELQATPIARAGHECRRATSGIRAFRRSDSPLVAVPFAVPVAVPVAVVNAPPVFYAYRAELAAPEAATPELAQATTAVPVAGSADERPP